MRTARPGPGPGRASRTGPLIRRVSHAERTRADILSVAVQLAARDGLEGLSVGALATAVGMSKAGVFAHFGSKEALQLAVVEEAFAQFVGEVAEPALAAEAGLQRLEALMDNYFDYVARRADQGGCFFTAASLEFDDRPGKVRDRILTLFEARLAMIEQALREARTQRDVRGDPAQLAFEVTSLALGTSVQFQLTRDPAIFQRARRALRDRLGL
jgi:AcrR family transcriptional regulator